MRATDFIAFLGVAAGAGFGAALATGPGAAADSTSPSPIDVWPYGVGGDGVNTLPGFAPYDPQGTIYHGDTPWYTVDFTSSGSHYHEVVTKVLDPAFGYPSVGTVADQYSIDIPVNITSQPTNFFDLYSDDHISDPSVGTGDYTTWFDSSFTNFYVSDKAGIEDQVTFGHGQPITLFDFPASGSSTGATDAGGELQQLMADLTGGAPGPDLF